ncbi:dynamin family protein [uncultured Brachyspira sp.]|uniref:dynamin family protein n=1 Tax=uncultured Brachyspira sp. TaxID=221953 RepID=UPI00260BBFC1|nr:dynamin family protein [uncultured Brachyspira sp.]
MINNQKKFIDILNNLYTISQKSDISNNKIEESIDLIKNVSLIVPVVGDFSSGKSTLLNKFIGKDILQVNIKPETAVPCELYYSKEEYAIGVDENGNEIKLEEVNTENTKDFLYIKRYVNSENLKKIDPIILVDMPGFDSPLENHNRAIMSYLDKGIYYILLTPVDAGTVSRSMINQINNIKNLKKDLSVFLTKTDLRDEDTVQKVKREIQDRLSDIDIHKTVNTINEKEIDLFDKMIKELNTEELFYSIFADLIKVICQETESSLKIKISALKSDVNQNKGTIEELEKAIKNLEEKREELIKEQKSKTYTAEIDVITQEIGNKLNSNIKELVKLAKSGDGDILKEEILNIAQSVVIEKIDSIIDDINLNINTSFSKEVACLDSSLNKYNIAEVSGNIQDLIRKYNKIEYVTKPVTTRKFFKSETALTTYTTATGIFAAVSSSLVPAIEIGIIVLPIVISLVVGLIDKIKEDKEIKDKIVATFPLVKREIRNKLKEILEIKTNEAINNIYIQYNENLASKVEELEKAQEELNKNGDVKAVISGLENNLKEVKNTYSSIK